MSLSVRLTDPTATYFHELYWANTTHNLNKMADAVGIYKQVWRPEECGIERAEQLIPVLEAGIQRLEADESLDAYNPPNGWGTREGFIPWLRRYLDACREYPLARVEACR